MLNMYDLDYLNTDMPWWNQDSVRSYTLGSNLFFAAPEMLLRDKGGTACMFFNSKVATDYGIDDLYALVDAGEWTQDMLIEYSEQVMADLGGEEGIDCSEDIWGALGADDPVYYLFNGFGQKFGHIDDFGYLEYNFSKGDSITIMQDIFLDFMYSDFYFNREVKKLMLEENENLFVDGKSLFYSGLVKDTTNELKHMEDLYGILPHPLLDVDQEDYSSLVWIHHDSSVGIPAHVKDPEMSAIILEALSWESYYSVYPVFYDTILLNRAAKDADSKRMLEIIFKTRSFDPGQYYDGGSTASGLHSDGGFLRLSSRGTADIAGIWEKYRETVEENMDNVNDWIAGNED
jgi:hypothetical protein